MSASIPLVIDIIPHAGQWDDVEQRLQRIEELVRKTLLAADFSGDSQSVTLCIVLSDDAEVQALNKQHRGKDAPTNVLSFPQIMLPSQTADIRPLGDIVLSYTTIMTEAKAEQKDFWHHFDHLIVHGTLHLLGFDHMTENEAQRMEQLEIDVLYQFGIPNPYGDTNTQ